MWLVGAELSKKASQLAMILDRAVVLLDRAANFGLTDADAGVQTAIKRAPVARAASAPGRALRLDGPGRQALFAGIRVPLSGTSEVTGPVPILVIAGNLGPRPLCL